MKKLDLGQIMGLLANVGVIVGILLLVVEISQNNELMAEQQRFNRLAISMKTNELFIENPSLAEIAVKNIATPEQLTPAERLIGRNAEARIIKAQAWSFRELPREELPIERWQMNAARDGWPLIWEQTKNQFDSEFIQFMEDEIIGH